MLKAFFLIALSALPVFSGPRANWSGPYEPCQNRSELLKPGHMSLGVRFDTANPVAAAGLKRALRFWSSVLDMDFHEDDSESCAVAIVDATDSILRENNDVARAQFTDWDNFQGWIAIDPHISEYMSADEIYATEVHELGHLFGLVHNGNPGSVMFYIDVDGNSALEPEDLRAIASRHALRAGISDTAIPVSVR